MHSLKSSWVRDTGSEVFTCHGHLKSGACHQQLFQRMFPPSHITQSREVQLSIARRQKLLVWGWEALVESYSSQTNALRKLPKGTDSGVVPYAFGFKMVQAFSISQAMSGWTIKRWRTLHHFRLELGDWQLGVKKPEDNKLFLAPSGGVRGQFSSSLAILIGLFFQTAGLGWSPSLPARTRSLRKPK